MLLLAGCGTAVKILLPRCLHVQITDYEIELFRICGLEAVGTVLHYDDRMTYRREHLFEGCGEIIMVVNDQNSSLHIQAGCQPSLRLAV